MDVSKFLSKVIGLYEILISIAMLTKPARFTASIHSLINNESLMLYIGCMTLIIGLLMIISHNIWQWQWRILVTIVAWIIFLKGATILFFPHALDKLTMLFVTDIHMLYIVGGFDLIFGVLLCYFGFRRSL